jgi:sulfate transport system permease protein
MFARQPGVLPGFGISLGFALTYLACIVLIPIGALLLTVLEIEPAEILRKVTEPRALAAYRLSFGAAALAACLNAAGGLLLAWIFERYRFPAKRIVEGLVDLPFALPTAVAGIALTSVYAANGWVGSHLEGIGVRVAYTRLGIVVALTFVGLPFVVRTVQPVLRDLPGAIEEAAATLGAGRWTVFRRILLPELLPPVATGFTLAFARGLGEYGSVIFIAGNMPMRTEVTPLLIMIKLEEYDFAGATAIALVFLVVSFAMLFTLNLLILRSGRRTRER